MNMIPYICKVCGGGYNRCGNNHCQNLNCSGGELCWEDESILVIKGTKINNYSDENVEDIMCFSLENLNKIFKGTYTGYGFFEVENCDFLFFDISQIDSFVNKNTDNYITVEPYCDSCFRNFSF